MTFEQAVTRMKEGVFVTVGDGQTQYCSFNGFIHSRRDGDEWKIAVFRVETVLSTDWRHVNCVHDCPKCCVAVYCPDWIPQEITSVENCL